MKVDHGCFAFSSRLFWLFVICAGCLSGWGAGCKREGKQVREAYEKAIEYGDSLKQKNPKIIRRKKLPGDVWRYVENNEMHNRPRLEVDVDLPYNAQPQTIRKHLKKLTTKAKAGTHYVAVRVRAWPRKLRYYGGIMGVSILATDGGGWSGEKVSYRRLKVTINKDEQARPPTKHEYSILLKLEETHRDLLQQKRYIRMAEKKPKRFHKQVVAKTAQKAGLTEASVAAIAARARDYYLQVPF